jgi:hypothetical protein
MRLDTVVHGSGSVPISCTCRQIYDRPDDSFTQDAGAQHAALTMVKGGSLFSCVVLHKIKTGYDMPTSVIIYVVVFCWTSN